ncbi:hypothetical protein FRC09_017454, partial [Ceratobasidium sp. 395]
MEVDESGSCVTLQCICVSAEISKTFPLASPDSWVNATLIRHGFLAPSPSRPTVAISLELLEILAAVQRRAPSASVEALSKAFCDLRNVPYRTHFCTQLTAALDAFHMICRVAQRRLDQAMGRDSPDWRIKHSCPPCTYKLEDEPALEYSVLVTCDGNDSLKRCSRAGTADTRVYDSDYYISNSEVERFKNEVAQSRVKAKDVDTEKSECEKRWKNAGADSRSASLTDFENCETLFSVSNRIAGGTRLASRYHRHKRIDRFFDCWNDDAYSNLGSLLRRKYVNTLKVIETASSFLAKFPGLSDSNLEKFFQEEVNYLASFKSGLPNDEFAANYVELLEQLEEKQSEFDELHSAAASNQADDKISDLRRNLTAMQLELKRRTVLDQLLNIRKSVEKIELERGIQERWTRGSQEWIDAQQLRHSRQFYKCLDELEHLIVQRVVEMSRAGLANT